MHWKTNARSHNVILRGMEAFLTPIILNKLLGNADAPSDVFMRINISPPN